MFDEDISLCSICVWSVEATHSAVPRVPLLATVLFSPHFDVICDLLLDRPLETWNLFNYYNFYLENTRIIQLQWLYVTYTITWTAYNYSYLQLNLLLSIRLQYFDYQLILTSTTDEYLWLLTKKFSQYMTLLHKITLFIMLTTFSKMPIKNISKRNMHYYRYDRA